MIEFADYNFNVAQTVHFFCDSVENIVRKEEPAGYQHFLFFHNVFKWLLFQSRVDP